MTADTLAETLKKRHALPPDFRFWKWEWMPHPEYTHMMLTGGVCPPLKSGPNKGKPNYKAGAKDKREFILSRADLEQLDQEYEAESGKCAKCEGAGKTIMSSSPFGTNYQQCKRCEGSGKPPVEVPT